MSLSDVGLTSLLDGTSPLSPIEVLAAWIAADNEAPKSYRFPKACWFTEAFGRPGASGTMPCVDGLFLNHIGESPTSADGWGNEENSYGFIQPAKSSKDGMLRGLGEEKAADGLLRGRASSE